MPKPVYVLCAENVSTDRETNLVSLFNVLERFEFTAGPQPADKIAAKILSPVVRAIAVWAREKGDLGKEFEHQFEIAVPGNPKNPVGPSPFQFGQDKILHRFVLTIQLGPMKSGALKITSKVRRKGAKSWENQSYEIQVASNLQTAGEVKAKPVHK